MYALLHLKVPNLHTGVFAVFCRFCKKKTPKGVRPIGVLQRKQSFFKYLAKSLLTSYRTNIQTKSLPANKSY